MTGIFDVRRDERHPALLGFLTLFGLMAAHTMMETARDTLFLVSIPVSRLPVFYLMVAAGSLGMARLGAVVGRRKLPFDAISASLVGGAVVALVFWQGVRTGSTFVVYGLYVWSGLFAAWAVGALWARFAEVFSVAQAKRLYGLIGSGAVLGACVGALIARAILFRFGVRHLLLVGAVFLLLAGVWPARKLAWTPKLGTFPHPPEEGVASSFAGRSAQVVVHPYCGRILGIMTLTATVGTLIDYLFKRQVTLSLLDAVAVARLFATTAIVTNLLSLVAQVLGVPIAMRVLGVQRALYVMPLFLIGGAGLALVGPGLGAIVAMRVVDGALRQSLQKTSIELLFVPLAECTRVRVKSVVDLLAQRGGQACASLTILALGLVVPRASAHVFGVIVLVGASGWLALAGSVRERYLELLRNNLRRGRSDWPRASSPLDVPAVDHLLDALRDPSPTKALAALDLLAAEEQTARIVPGVLLAHPSHDVVLRGLEVLLEAGRVDFVASVDRLLEHPALAIRQAALRARGSISYDQRFFSKLLDDASEEVRATALVILVAHGDGAASVGRLRETAFASVSVEVRLAISRMIGDANVDAGNRMDLEEALARLAGDDDEGVRREVAHSMASLDAPCFVPALLALLHDPQASHAAAEALCRMGGRALPAINEALDRKDLPEDAALRLLGVLARSSSAEGVASLVNRLDRARGPTVGRILRALRIAEGAGAKVSVPAEKLCALANDALDRVADALTYRLAEEEHAGERGTAGSSGSFLLDCLLRDREKEGIEQLFVVLGLLVPSERFGRIERGLTSSWPDVRAASLELLDNLLGWSLRQRVCAAVETLEDRERLRLLARPRTKACHVAMWADDQALRDVLAYRASEINSPGDRALGQE